MLILWLLSLPSVSDLGPHASAKMRETMTRCLQRVTSLELSHSMEWIFHNLTKSNEYLISQYHSEYAVHSYFIPYS